MLSSNDASSATDVVLTICSLYMEERGHPLRPQAGFHALKGLESLSKRVTLPQHALHHRRPKREPATMVATDRHEELIPMISFLTRQRKGFMITNKVFSHIEIELLSLKTSKWMNRERMHCLYGVLKLTQIFSEDMENDIPKVPNGKISMNLIV